MKHLLVVAFVVAFVAPAVHAQERSRGGAVFVRTNVESDVVKGAPYSADVINESTQTLSDGNRIVHRSTSRVYRDSEGRTRREEDRPSGSFAISISDPVAGSSWTLDTELRTARKSPFLPRIYGGIGAGNGELQTLQLLLNGQLSSFVARGGGGLIAVRNPNEQSAEEKLAARTIEGVRVDGVRKTMTIPAGAIGNERPIVVTSEEWTSPELKTVVLSESNDPRTGTSSYKLVSVKRGDPPALLFQVPADYTVQQGGGIGVGVGAGGRGGRGGAPPR